MVKVVIHVSEKEKWPEANANARNLLKEVGKAQIEIVVNSAAVNLFHEPSEGTMSQLQEMSQLGVNVSLCRNALRFNDIEEASLPKEVNVVPAAIATLVERQHEGFAYVKP